MNLLEEQINQTEDCRSPLDAEGHGTHAASTAAGNLVPGASFLGNAKGAATGMMFTARIAAYKVCYAFGCSSLDILAAMIQLLVMGSIYCHSLWVALQSLIMNIA